MTCEMVKGKVSCYAKFTRFKATKAVPSYSAFKWRE
jgi:hypothetical protein